MLLEMCSIIFLTLWLRPPHSYFLEQNNHIFQTLLEVSATEDKALTTDHMKAMGLDPVGDRQFIMDLVELYGIDIILMIDTPCCPVWKRPSPM